jgi:ABC-type branched-subunit amino acid transport system substrate-binding protein
MSRSLDSLGIILLVAGCQSNAQPAIASAVGARTSPSLLDVVAPVLDSSGSGIGVRRWSLRGYDLTLHSSQAELFAADPGVVAVVGHPGSRDALLGAAVYNREELPQVVPTATSRVLKRAGPWTFTLAPDDSVEGAFLADWAIDSAKARRVAVMYIGDEYGIGILEGVRGGLAIRGQQVVDQVLLPGQPCGPGSANLNRDIYSAISRSLVRRARPDVVILAASNASGWCIVDQVHSEDSSIWILGADGFNIGQPPATFRAAYNHARLRSVAFWEPGEHGPSLDFVHRFSRVTGRLPTAGDAMEYDAFMLLRQAILDVGTDRRAIRDWLQSLGRSRPSFPGVTGPVSFDRPRASILRMTAVTPPVE